MMSDYKNTVNQILTLTWERLTLETLTCLMWVSLTTAHEFADSLRVAINLEEYKNDPLLKEMVAGELKTNNLEYSTWKKTGDHWEFLEYFLKGTTQPEMVSQACEEYCKTVESLPPNVRAMSIFSREEELSKIFARILAAQIWNERLPENLKAFGYYLATHIVLDSNQGGHQDLTSHLEITNEVGEFYKARLQLYITAIPSLKR